MILTLRKNLTRLLLSLVLLTALLPSVTFGQGSQTLSVSPTLFNMSANPGQTWQSALRVINPNQYELSVYVDIVDFVPDGEAGQGSFIPANTQDTEATTFAEWITTDSREFLVAPEQTIQIPFSITVPENAPPGGHSVALLVGTKPLQDSSEITNVETSQVITSLVFLRVAGDVIESGLIREFRTARSIIESPDTSFVLRFENNGNVHLQPQGEIKIFNMWGQERGVVPINQRTLFGNVLPNSIRAYNFGWKGEWSIADIGRYTAVATVAYGEEERQFASMETAFWIIPWKGLLGIVAVLAFFIGLFTWAIKVYIRRMLQLAQVPSAPVPQVIIPPKKVSVVAPLEAGILDLRSRLREEKTAAGFLQTLIAFVKSYQFFFVIVLLGIIFILLVIWFITNASQDQRAYEFTVEGGEESVVVPTEE